MVMPLFRVVSGKLSPIRTKPVELEKDIQRLIEANLMAVFGLTFVSSEFQPTNLRVDTLGYDPENKSFVVIEYKRDRNSSVVDQGYAYLATVLNQKADFVLEYNERTKSSSTKTDFDWTATRVLFVAPRFTPHQLGAINFNDLPIELWEVRLYEDGLLSVEQRVADSQAASIKTVSKKTAVSKPAEVVENEIKTYTVDDVFAPRLEKQRAVFDEVDQAIRSLDDSINAVPKKTYVGYRIGSDWRNFVALDPVRDGVRIEFNRTQPQDLKDPEMKLVYNENSMKWYNQHITWMNVQGGTDLDYVQSMLQQAYNRHLKQFG